MLTIAAPIVIAISSMLAQAPTTPAPAPTGSAPVVGAAPAPAPAGAKVQTVGADAPGTSVATPAGQAVPVGAPGGGQAQQQPSMLTGMMLPVLMLGFVVFIFWTSSRAQKKEKLKRQELMESLRTNDTVQTTGGIIGRIAEIRDDEVVLRVDESTNTKIRFAKVHIAGVINKAGGATSESEAKPGKAKAGV
jgi:preprotein translocase subunit YajC